MFSKVGNTTDSRNNSVRRFEKPMPFLNLFESFIGLTETPRTILDQRNLHKEKDTLSWGGGGLRRGLRRVSNLNNLVQMHPTTRSPPPTLLGSSNSLTIDAHAH